MEYKNENKICQNCKNDFTIEPDDFNFYEKIKVPAPTFCPECRMKRRTSFRNVRSLYKRTCGLCSKNIITMHHENDPAPIYCYDCWHGDGWDPYFYGKEIDWSKSFLSQWYELFRKVPRFDLWKIPPLQKSEYTNYSINNKNCYLAYSVIGCENVRYSENIDTSMNCLDNLYLSGGENCTENIDSAKNYNSHHIIQSRQCIDSMFLFDCINCQHCFMSSNIRNKNYIFRGQQLSKNEYDEKILEIQTHSYSENEKLNSEFKELVSFNSIHKYSNVVSSPNSKGNHILNSKNVADSYGVKESENIKYSMRVLDNAKDSQDVYGLAKGELIYDCLAVSYRTYNCAFSFLCNTNMRDSQYSAFSVSSSNIFGCVGIKKGEFSILNKRFPKEEYYVLVEKIKKQMNEIPYIDKVGLVYKYGEFFPAEFSPYFYNETIARDLYPISQRDITAQGFLTAEIRNRTYNVTLKNKDIPDSSKNISTDICSDVIECFNLGLVYNQCTNVFRILPEDLDFYQKFNLPLPRLCPNCRHYERLSKREPVKLWHRKCMKEGCSNGFETSYAPDRPEIVYCEKCYQQEVY